MTRDDFEFWLFKMDDELEDFFHLVPASLAAKLDYSAASLNDLERWLLSRYPSYKDLLKREELPILDGISRYVGEVFRKKLGGHWDIRLDDPKYVYYNIPQLVGFDEKDTPVCPVSLTTASLSRRTGEYLNGSFKNKEKSMFYR